MTKRFVLSVLLILFSAPLLFAQASTPSVIAVPSTPTSCGKLPLKVISGTSQVYGTDGSGGTVSRWGHLDVQRIQ